MARKVFVSSAMSTDEGLDEIAEIEPLAALMWPWLLTYFDDWGRAKASPREIKNSVFQANSAITVDLITRALQLYRDRLIQIYEVNGKWFMTIEQEKWFKFQTHIRRDKRENDGSKIPPPPSNDNSAQMREVTLGFAEVSAGARDYTPSPSPSLSPSPSPSSDKTSSSSGIGGDNPFGLFEKHEFGKIDTITSQMIGDEIDDHTEEWVVRAMREAIIQKIIKWSYVKSILKRWKATNHAEPWTLEKEEPPKTNVTPINNRSSYRSGPVKQQIPVITPDTTHSGRLSEEEMAAARAMADKLDVTFKNRSTGA